MPCLPPVAEVLVVMEPKAVKEPVVSLLLLVLAAVLEPQLVVLVHQQQVPQVQWVVDPAYWELVQVAVPYTVQAVLLVSVSAAYAEVTEPYELCGQEILAATPQLV
jgi:hypothetical protein